MRQRAAARGRKAEESMTGRQSGGVGAQTDD